MISGAHVIVYSRNPEADRAFIRDVLALPSVDVGDGWLHFGLPPAELAFHPGRNDEHELYLMCDDVQAFIAAMKRKNIECAPILDEAWGVLTSIELPGGGTLGVYQPKHERAPAPGS